MSEIDSRVYNEALYILKTGKTIREIAQIFAISKSTVYIDLTKRLKKIDANLYTSVRLLFSNHISVRHIRGGESTRKKYKNLV